MNNTNEHIEQLILKQLTNEATAPELAELKQWLEVNPANQEEYESFQQIWASSSTALQQPVFDTAAAWQKMQPATTQRGPRLLWKVVFGAAAILFFLTLGGWFLFQASEKGKTETKTAGNGIEQTTLPDSSIVWLRKGSTIRYPAAFTHDRTVELEGEAYFEIKPDPTNIFRVGTAKAWIEVLGTHFEVRHTNDAEKLLVTDGRVRFSDRRSPDRQLVVTKGQSASLTDTTITRDSLPQQNRLAWKTNSLEFSNTPLKAVIADLEDTYGIGIALSPALKDSGANIRITARFPTTERPAGVLEEIRLMTGLSARRQQDTVILYRP